MVKCLTLDRGTEGLRVRASPASLCCVLEQDTLNPSLVLVQPRRTRPFITERLLMGRKESNQTKTFKNDRYSKTCLKRPLKKSAKIGFQYRLSVNSGQKYCSILQYFRPSLSYHLPSRSLFCLLFKQFYCISVVLVAGDTNHTVQATPLTVDAYLVDIKARVFFLD